MSKKYSETCAFARISQAHRYTILKNAAEHPFAALITCIITAQRVFRGYLVRLQTRKESPLREEKRKILSETKSYFLEALDTVRSNYRNGLLDKDQFLKSYLKRIQSRFRTRLVRLQIVKDLEQPAVSMNN